MEYGWGGGEGVNGDAMRCDAGKKTSKTAVVCRLKRAG
jgi:hypothetical protein